MNIPREYLTVIFLLLFTATLIWCPWHNQRSKESSGFSPFFLSPVHQAHEDYTGFGPPIHIDAYRDANDQIDFSRLVCEWMALGVIYSGLFFLFKNPKASATKKVADRQPPENSLN